MLESAQEIVSQAHDDDVTMRPSLPPLLDPQVQDLVQIQVRQQGRDRRSLRRSLVAMRIQVVVVQDTRTPPFLASAEDLEAVARAASSRSATGGSGGLVLHLRGLAFYRMGERAEALRDFVDACERGHAADCAMLRR